MLNSYCKHSVLNQRRNPQTLSSVFTAAFLKSFEFSSRATSRNASLPEQNLSASGFQQPNLQKTRAQQQSLSGMRRRGYHSFPPHVSQLEEKSKGEGAAVARSSPMLPVSLQQHPRLAIWESCSAKLLPLGESRFLCCRTFSLPGASYHSPHSVSSVTLAVCRCPGT